MAEAQHAESGNGSDSRVIEQESPNPDRPSFWPAATAAAALILALVAVGGVAWMWLERSPVDPIDPDEWVAAEEFAQLRGDLDGQERRFGELDASIDDVAEELDAMKSELADLRQSLRGQREESQALDSRFDALDADLAEAMERLEAASGEQRAVDRELARRLHLMEAAALLRMGQERAELAGDLAGAREAYRRAYGLLGELDDARANQARGQIAREIEALEELSGPDWVAMIARVSRIAAGADEWPALELAGDPDLTPEIDAEETSWWSGVGSVLTGLVRVRPRDTVPVSVEELDGIREQVRLRLAAAEMALARRSLEEAAGHFQHAGDLIERWFDTDHAAVTRALTELDELADTELATLPPLGNALAEINRLLEAS